MKPSLLLMLFIPLQFFYSTLFSQVKRCYTYDLLKQNSEKSPDYAAAVNAAFEYAKSNVSQFKTSADSVLRVPVVVHIVYRDQTENIDDSLIYNQIEVLNEDYRRLNADAVYTRQEFASIAADANIEFYLAEVDPNGNLTSGIVRQSSNAAYFISFDLQTFSYSMDVVKYDSAGGSNAWPVDKYLNIWVCDLSFPIIGDALLGFAYPPIGAKNWPTGSTPVDPNADGVVIHYKVFGRNNPNAVGVLADASKGRTATHEVGHYLGLRHIWGDGDCTMDDGISDTPDADSDANFECNYSKNTCSESPIDYPDMIENYMDYAADDCQNVFTKEQADLMRSSLLNLRSGLLTEQTAGIKGGYALSNKALLYPSPANDYVNVKVFSTIENNTTIEVFSVVGEKMKEMPMNASELKISISDLQAGTYFISLKESSGKTLAKLPFVVCY